MFISCLTSAKRTYDRLSSLWADGVASGLMALRRMSRDKPPDDEQAPAALDPTPARAASPQAKRPRTRGESLAIVPAPDAGSEADPLELDTIALLDGPLSTAPDDDGDGQLPSAAREREREGAELGGPRAASVAADEVRVALLAEHAGADADIDDDATAPDAIDGGGAPPAPALPPAAEPSPPSTPSALPPAAEPSPPSTPSAAAKRARLAPASEAATPTTSVAAPRAPAHVSPRARLLGMWERCVWADEFEREGLPDPSRWAFQTDANEWIHKPSHRELQWYTEGRLENARVADGLLRICARREPWGGCAFTSARLRTKGLADWEYGRIEVCAKLPAARRGLWPAIWLVSSDNRYGSWPASGEIDVMENLGAEPGVLHGSVHTALFNHRKKTHKSRRTYRADAHEAFHVYSLEWTADGLALAVDDEVFFEFRKQAGCGSDAWPFDHPFHLILNIAVGGNWGGKDGIADDVCPAEMAVAYVRVFQ